MATTAFGKIRAFPCVLLVHYEWSKPKVLPGKVKITLISHKVTRFDINLSIFFHTTVN